MPNAIRFHLDENSDPRIATALRQRGIDVTTTADAGLLHAKDEGHLAFALSEGRMIVTQDADFLRLDAMKMPHPGIAYCQQESRTLGEIIRSLVLIWEIYDSDEVRNRVEFI
jgi:predicted nuclease of predicted toxin-antitoxin system